ncbi:MAG: spore germination protein, partial [Myxococcota bacterium]
MISLTLLHTVAMAGTPQELPGELPLGAHHRHLLQLGAPDASPPPPPAIPPPASGGPDVTVYGYHAYWSGSPLDLDFTRLTHVAVFNVDLNDDGTLSDTSRWTDHAAELVPLAHSYGVKVHLCMTSFYDSTTNAVLASSSKRATAIAELKALVDAYGADGVNVDIEGLDYSQKQNMVTFIEELAAEVDEVVIATPAIDWLGAFDYDALAYASDGLFIMGYGYHWSGGNPGPLAPLYGGGIWSDYSLEWTVEDYLTNGAPADKIILGLPLYGREWPTSSSTIPGTATDDGDAVFMSSAVSQAASGGADWDTTTHTPYILESNSQLWYDNTDSIRDRTAYAVEAGIQGIGFWALTYEGGDPEFWQMI